MHIEKTDALDLCKLLCRLGFNEGCFALTSTVERGSILMKR